MLLLNAFVLSGVNKLKVTSSKKLSNVKHLIPSHQTINVLWHHPHSKAPPTTTLTPLCLPPTPRSPAPPLVPADSIIQTRPRHVSHTNYNLQQHHSYLRRTQWFLWQINMIYQILHMSYNQVLIQIVNNQKIQYMYFPLYLIVYYLN